MEDATYMGIREYSYPTRVHTYAYEVSLVSHTHEGAR